MSWWHHLWPRRVNDTTAEARRALRKLEQLDDQIAQLEKELRETQRRNNFSGMVQEAITRTVRERGTAWHSSRPSSS